MSFSHVVYIDEAGDEGFGKLKTQTSSGQSQWLLVGATIVRGKNDPHQPTWRDGILARFLRRKRRDLHFRDLNHDQKVVTSQVIGQLPIHTCVTFSNKATIPGSPYMDFFKRPGYLYNYLTRWLLERVTSFCHLDAQSTAIRASIRVVFSQRQGTDYQAMRQYMELMRGGREVVQPTRSINWSVFDPANIAVENHARQAGLQIADAVTSAYYKAVEPNLYGNYETSYADLLRPLAITHRGGALNVGVTPVPGIGKCAPNPHQRAFFMSFAR